MWVKSELKRLSDTGEEMIEGVRADHSYKDWGNPRAVFEWCAGYLMDYMQIGVADYWIDIICFDTGDGHHMQIIENVFV